MAEAVTLIGWLLNIGSLYGGYILGKKQEKEQYRRELIEKYYPPLIENLRESTLNSNKKFREGYLGEFEAFFEVLLEMRKDDTLRIIESIDKEVYAELMIIVDELLPALEEIQDRRYDSFETIEDKWLSWFLENEDSLPEVRASFDSLAHRARSSIIYNIWRKEPNLEMQNIEEICQIYFLKDDNTPELRACILEAFRTIANKEWKPIISDFDIVNEQLKELIDEKILPRMGDKLYSLGK